MSITRLSTSLVLALGLFAGCSNSEPDVLTYDEFAARAYQEPDTGFRILNGDELVENDEAMQALYESYLDSVAAAADREAGLGTVSQGLIVNTVGGADDKWAASTAQNLTYCISSSSFGANYSAVVSAMSSATGAWESAAGGGVNFVHVSSLDGSCNNRSNVVFNVRQVTTNQYLARAFFPSTSRSGREILVARDTFGNIKPWSVTGVMRHELGHTIGFRHEHTRPESGTCFEDNNWRALTSYDSGSVMHYPQCNGSGTWSLSLTTKDKTGASAAYP